MPKPHRRAPNPIERAREALGSRSPEADASADDPGAEAAAAGSGLRRSVAKAGQRIQEIVDTAELVAREIEADAREQADRYLEERRRESDRLFEAQTREADELVVARAQQLSDLSEAVTSRAQAILAQVEELRSELMKAVEQMQAVPPDEEATPPAWEEGASGEERVGRRFSSKRETNTTPAITPQAYPGTPQAAQEPTPLRAESAASEDALLRATQMAVAGNSRSEIEETLRREFGVTDPSSVADEILGSE